MALSSGYSYVQYEGDGSTTQFSVTFPYLKRSHVEVREDGSTVSFSWADSGTVQTDTAPADGSTIEVRRVTPKDARLVDFVAGSNLTSKNLDKNSNQLFYAVQEAFDNLMAALPLGSDGTWDADDRVISNIARSEDPNAAATVEQAYGEAVDAHGWADEAEEWAQKTGETVTDKDGNDTGEYSAKEYAVGSTIETGSAQFHANNASVWAANAEDSKEAAADDAQRAMTAASTATSARDAAQTARDDAQAAEADAESARDDAQSARDTAYSHEQDALTAKGTAVSAKDTAVSAKDTALTAESDAQDARDAAQTAETNAQSHEQDAQSAKNAAQTARDDAQAAEADAESARDDAQSARDAAYNHEQDALAFRNDAQTAEANATDDAGEAERWATEAEDTTVTDDEGTDTGKYSAFHHAQKAAADASTANTAASDATTAKNDAQDARDTSETYRDEAETARDAALGFKTDAADSEITAERWANEAEDTTVVDASTGSDTGEYSAYHWAQKSQQYSGGVRVSGDDDTSSVLDAKLSGGNNISLTVENPGGTEVLRVDGPNVPVQSVNGQTGNVSLGPGNVGAEKQREFFRNWKNTGNNQSVSDGTGTRVAWNNTPLVDTAGAWDGSNDVWVVPSGVKYLRAEAALKWANLGTDESFQAIMRIKKNGNNIAYVRRNFLYGTEIQGSTGILDAAQGDVIEVEAFQTSGSAQDLRDGNNEMWFSIEAMY